MRIVVDLQGAQNESRFRGIGRYSMSLARAMAQHAGSHELWFALNAGFPESFEHISNNLRDLVPPERLCVFEVPPGLNQIVERNQWRVRAAECVREQFLAQLRPDFVHITSWFEGPLDDTVSSIDALEFGIPQAVTLYDLIPLLRPESYLPEVRVRNWYFRKTQLLRRANLLLAISNSSAKEARDGLLIPDENIAMIGAGVDVTFRPPKEDPDRDADIRRRYDLDGPLILYTGAADPRKNLTGLLHAMAALPGELRDRYVLACVGKLFPHQQADLVRLIAKLGFRERRVRLLGYVPDADLVPLYAMCELFVFPSIHEGFGLPAAEAMACGAPVIGSNTTSVPDVIGRVDALFDPTKPEDMARVMTSVLASKPLQNELRAHGIRRSKAFDWDSVARRALEAFEAAHDREKQRGAVMAGRPPRQKLALVSPLRPSAASRAEIGELIRVLSPSFEITCICEDRFLPTGKVLPGIPLRNAQWFAENGAGFDTIIYVVRNASRSGFMVPLLERWPGFALLKDFDCAELVASVRGCATVDSRTAVYDSHGLSAVLANRKANGVAELPINEAIFRMSDGVLVHEASLVETVRRLYGTDVAKRMRVVPRLEEAGASDLARAWRDAILDLNGEDRQRYRATLAAISKIGRVPQPGDPAAIASALAANTRRFGLPQIFVDVSTIAEKDARSGIQRVVRSVLAELLALAPPGWRVEPVRVDRDGYVYARDFALRAFRLPAGSLPHDAPVETQRGDIFLGLDLIAHLLPPRRAWFEAQRMRGLNLTFVIYDLVPLRRPELFPWDVPPMFQKWSAVIGEVADRVICISQAVADEFSEWIASQNFRRVAPIEVGWFHLGADLEASLPTIGIPPDGESILAALRSRPTFLSVGTLEPRKRHAQTLDAFELLWARGTDAGFAIVGQQGWKTEALATRIGGHPEAGRRLFWLKGISDEMLNRVYQSCACLLTASEGEGFGLPLIEAARHHKPVLARDLPVFREVAGDSVYYFSGEDAESLASAIDDWLVLRATGKHPGPQGIQCQTWNESARQLLAALLNETNSDRPFRLSRSIGKNSNRSACEASG